MERLAQRNKIKLTIRASFLHFLSNPFIDSSVAASVLQSYKSEVFVPELFSIENFTLPILFSTNIVF